VCSRACTLSQYRTKLLLLSHNFSNGMINNTSSNEAHYEPQSPIASANNVYELCNTGALVNYLHKALFSPTKSALLRAVKKGNLITWTGLTDEAIHKHLKMMPATAMGHMN
jgi:hypothetical protein